MGIFGFVTRVKKLCYQGFQLMVSIPQYSTTSRTKAIHDSYIQYLLPMKYGERDGEKDTERQTEINDRERLREGERRDEEGETVYIYKIDLCLQLSVVRVAVGHKCSFECRLCLLKYEYYKPIN